MGIEVEEVLGSRSKVQRSTEKMAGIKRFEEIEAWQVAGELTQRIYAITKEGPFSKDYGLRDQILAP